MNVPDHINLQDINDQRRRSEERKQQQENAEKDRQRLMYCRIAYAFLDLLRVCDAIWNVQPDPLYLLPFDDCEIDQIIEEIDAEHISEAEMQQQRMVDGTVKLYVNRPSTGPHFARLPHPARVAMLQMVHDALYNKCTYFGEPKPMPLEGDPRYNWSAIRYMRLGDAVE